MCEIAIALYVLQAAVVTITCRERQKHSWTRSIAAAAGWPLLSVALICMGCSKLAGGASK